MVEWQARSATTRDSLDLICQSPHHPGMNRRRFLLTLLAGAIAVPLTAGAQQAAKIARIGWLGFDLTAATPAFLEAFRQGLHDLGYVEGRNLVIEYRDAEGKLERLPALAAELAALKVDVIVASGTVQALAAQKATKTIPTVFLASDPVASGLVTTLARPGGNLTGVSTLGPDLVGKGLEVLKQAVPGVSPVAVLWHSGASGERMERNMVTDTEAAGRALGVQLQFAKVPSPDDFDGAFSAMTRARVGALAVLPSVPLSIQRKRLVALAERNRLPALYISMREIVAAGGLMSYGANSRDLFPRMATYVDRILKGAKPGDLPVEQPTQFELVINLKTAKALGLTIPPSLLARADQVIE
jgi:putative tryptophan/tyrosine transport system substrate-binding protein